MVSSTSNEIRGKRKMQVNKGDTDWIKEIVFLAILIGLFFYSLLTPDEIYKICDAYCIDKMPNQTLFSSEVILDGNNPDGKDLGWGATCNCYYNKINMSYHFAYKNVLNLTTNESSTKLIVEPIIK
jgi:hypothetical protein